MPRVVSVCAHPSVWSPTSLCAAATAPPTTASASCTCGPAKSRWTSEWSARESAVSDACRPAARAHGSPSRVLIGVTNRMEITLRLNNETRKEWITKRPFWDHLLWKGVDCIANRKGSVASLWIPFQKSILLASQPVNAALCRAAFAGNGLTLTCTLCLMQKRVAALFVPGGPDASGTSASAHSAQARPSRRSAAATASLTTTSASSVRRPVCRRGGSTWSSTAAAMKVGKWAGRWCNYA